MPLHTLGSLLGATQELKALTALARRLRELQSLYSRSAPRDLAVSSRVKSCRAGTLYVSADNAAVAAKLKQLAPRLLASIRESEAEITKIRIEVQVSGREPPRVYKSQKKALTPASVTRIHELAARVSDAGLRAALDRLARRHEGRATASDQHEALDHVQQHDHDHHHEDELKRSPRQGQVAPVAGVHEQAERDRDRE